MRTIRFFDSRWTSCDSHNPVLHQIQLVAALIRSHVLGANLTAEILCNFATRPIQPNHRILQVLKLKIQSCPCYQAAHCFTPQALTLSTCFDPNTQFWRGRVNAEYYGLTKKLASLL